MQRNHIGLRKDLWWLGKKNELELMQQGKRFDQELSEILSDRAAEMGKAAEELQRQCDEKLAREQRLRERAAVLMERSRVDEHEDNLQNELEELSK